MGSDSEEEGHNETCMACMYQSHHSADSNPTEHSRCELSTSLGWGIDMLGWRRMWDRDGTSAELGASVGSRESRPPCTGCHNALDGTAA